jgi:MATE family, multidrug efflux pump
MSRSLVRELVRLGWPVLIAQLAVMANSVIDTIMAGRYGTLDLAAVGIGASIYFSVFVTLMGVLLALTPIVAHMHGADRHADIGEELRQGAWLAAALALISLALFAFPEPFLVVARLAPELEVKVRAYLCALAWAVPASLLFRVFYSFSTAISRPRTVMALTLIGLALKVPFNWVFMYGNLGAAELGSTGCAVATALISWILLPHLRRICALVLARRESPGAHPRPGAADRAHLPDRCHRVHFHGAVHRAAGRAVFGGTPDRRQPCRALLHAAACAG